MILVKYQDLRLKALDSLSISTSSREVTFNDITVDFTGYTIDDLPIQYQEVQIVEYDEAKDIDEKVYFTGYILSHSFDEMNNTWEDRFLTLELASPYELTTVRSVSCVDTGNLADILETIIQPMIDDGFVISAMNVVDKEVTVGYLLETVETCLNDLSNKYNFWWYIDENKNMYFYDLDYLFSKQVTNNYNLSNLPYQAGSIQLSMDATDYCNVVNFKNVRVYTPSILTTSYSINPFVDSTSISLSTNDTIELAFPFDITAKNVEKAIKSNALNEGIDESFNEPFILKITTTSGNTIEASIKLVDGQIVYNNITTETTNEDVSELFSITTDSFFSTLVTSLTYLGDDTINGTITQMSSCSGLKWTKMRFVNNEEIEKCKGVISTSGRVEKIVGLDEAWKTEEELKDIATSYLKLNQTQTDEVTFTVYSKPNFGIGDIVNFDLDEFFINSDFIITDMTWNYVNDNDQSWDVTLRNKNYLENFIDTFRGDEYENDDTKDTNLITVNYIAETIKEHHSIDEITYFRQYNYTGEIIAGEVINL